MKRYTTPEVIPDGPRLQSGEPLKDRRKTTASASGRGKRLVIFSVSLLVTALMTGVSASAAGTMSDIVTTLFGESTQTVDIVILLTILTLLPSIVMMMTGFTRIVIVLSFIRNAMGMQTTPPSQIIIGLALFLTLFVMGPVLTEVYEEAYIPYSNQEIDQSEFFDRAMSPTREFMARQIYPSDLEFFMSLSREPIPEVGDVEDLGEVLDKIPNKVLIPAFLLSEIKTAFQIGFFIYIPFIVIDMVVASTLMAMGMMMLPPAMISLPFKVLMFVLVDGWQMVIGALIGTFK